MSQKCHSVSFSQHRALLGQLTKRWNCGPRKSVKILGCSSSEKTSCSQNFWCKSQIFRLFGESLFCFLNLWKGFLQLNDQGKHDVVWLWLWPTQYQIVSPIIFSLWHDASSKSKLSHRNVFILNSNLLFILTLPRIASSTSKLQFLVKIPKTQNSIVFSTKFVHPAPFEKWNMAIRIHRYNYQQLLYCEISHFYFCI